MLTDAQSTILKNDILSKAAGPLAAWGPFDGSGDNPSIAFWYSQTAVPALPLWRPDVPTDEMRNVIVGDEFVSFTPNGVARQNGWFAITQGRSIDATKQTMRNWFQAIFGSGSVSLTNLNALAKRNATNFEVLFTGAPIQGASVCSVFGQGVRPEEVQHALMM